MSKWKLMASAESCNDLRELIESRWYWTNVTFDLVTKEVKVNNKVFDGIRVTIKGNRYRLEREVKS